MIIILIECEYFDVNWNLFSFIEIEYLFVDDL